VQLISKPLEGKIALVTGAAKRLGRASAVALGEAGAHVAVTFLRSNREAQQTVKHIERFGSRSLAIRCDITDPNSVRAAVRGVVRRLGGIDILVNNAGLYETVSFQSLSVQQWDAMFAVNVRGPFLMVKEALKHLRSRKGKIINIGSLGGVRPWATHAHYCASKAALHMLTKAMAKALAPEIAVNCIAPGMIDLGESRLYMRRMAQQTPMRRNGTAKDVADAVLLFATAPHFVTGQILVVDGGLGL
jgi:3-oxoacyl-[acyl-carrier protein] reductase/pteridine reductase